MRYSDNPFTDILHKHPHQECSRCVMNTSDPWITFNEQGLCNYCQSYDAYIAQAGTPENRRRKLETMVDNVKRSGRGNAYDCVMGVSGGVDSSYLAWLAVKELGLRPLVVHVDAGWNSELAVNNIQNIVQRLNLNMHTLVIDWPELRDLQRAYFRSGIANLDVPQDHVIIASLFSEARKYGIKSILSGANMQTESILPNAWGYDASDAVSIKAIHRKFGTTKLKRYPTVSNFKRMLYYPFVLGIKKYAPLNLVEYNKHEAKRLLIEELGWRDYGGKHYESAFTKFFQAHYLPTKFGYDKRLAHYASLIVSGQLTKEQALRELEKPLYELQELQDDKSFWIKKLGVSENEYAQVMSERPAFYTDFSNSEAFQSRLRSGARIAERLFRHLTRRE
jgi:N-acetyl sugar amidotransferase